MAIEIPSNNQEMITLRRSVASTVTLSPQHLKLNRQLVNEGFEMMIKPLFTEPYQRPLMEHLSNLSDHIRERLSYPISPRMLSAAFAAHIEAEKFSEAALVGLREQNRLGTDIALHMFAHSFDIASGILTACHRFVIVEDELNGLTSSGIERRDQMVREIGIRLPAADLATVYGESIFYAKNLAELLRNEDTSATPGTILFTDLIARLEEGQFVPGILSESFRGLVILGVEDAKRVYENIYPFSTKALLSSA